MMGIIGKKIGMTQTFDEQGNVSPVTVIQAGPCVVVQRKTAGRDGYEAVQLGFVEPRSPRKTSKALRGHFERVGAEPVKFIREFRLDSGEAEIEAGQEVRVDVLRDVEKVDVTGVSKGKGGRMGGDRVTVRNLKVVRIIEDQNLLLVRGAVPGGRNGYLLIRASRASKRKAAGNA